jgi:MFS family permease
MFFNIFNKNLTEIFSKPFIFLLLTILLAEVGSTMVTPLMPFLFFSSHSPFFDLSAGHEARSIGYGYAIAAIRLGAFLASVLLGLAMDKWGRRWVLFLSCFGLACSMGVVAISVDKASFVLFIEGLFFSNLLYAGKQTTQSMIGDETSSPFKLLRMSLLQSGIAIGACLGPLLSGNLLKGIPLSSPFWVASGFSILASVVVLVFVQETLSRDSAVLKEKFSLSFLSFRWVKSGRDLLNRPRVGALLLQLLLTQLSWGAYYEFSPLIGKLNFNFTPQISGLFVGSIAFWLILGSGVFLPLLRGFLSLFQLKRLSVFGMLLGALLNLIAGYFHSWGLVPFWVSAFFMASGDVMIYALLVNELSDAVAFNFQGRMTGLIYVVITITWTFTGVLGGYLTAYMKNGVSIFMVLGVAVLSLYWMMSRSDSNAR